MSGTTPPGTQSEEQASRWVRSMFSEVAPRYDLLNHLLSFQIDKYWRARTVGLVKNVLLQPEARIVDLCCGTGDLTQALERERGGKIFASDFCHPMLQVAARKGLASPLFEADALSLPLASGSADLITVAFGVRNFANYERGLAELLRVLKPGGTLAILEFSTPPNAMFRQLYNFYSLRILPAIGRLISGSRDAYTYLPESVRKFPDGGGLAVSMRDAGFSNVEFQRLTFGIVAVHTGQKP